MNGQTELDFNPASDTSRDAAIFNLPNRERDRDRVLHALIEMGEYGGTDFDIEAATGIKQTSCGKRRLELERDGFVARRLVVDPATMRLVPDRREAPSGALAGVYVLAVYSTPEQRP